MKPEDVKKVAIVGAGVMGHSIAQVFAQAGIKVGLVDLNDEALDHAVRLIRNNLKTLAGLGKVADSEIEPVLDLIHPTTDLSKAADGADFALEAAAEVPDVKKKVFSDLEKLCSKDTVLASNTSGLEIFDIVQLNQPERLVGAHWFAPPHIIPLVEVAPGPDTAPEAVTFTAALMERIGKKPVVMERFVRAFIVNRIQNNIGMAVWEMLLNNWATPEQIDLAVKTSLGIRLPIVGVVQTLDFTGLDLIYQMMQNLGFENKLIEDKFNQGHLGAKTSKGIYDYGGRSEEEILRKRDELYIKLYDFLEELEAFQPI